MSNRQASLILSIILLFSVLAIPLATTVAQKEVKGPYLDEVVFVSEPDSAKALKRIEAGELQLYMWYLTGEGAKEAEEHPEVGTIRGHSGVIDIFVNPVPFPNKFNPFSIREVREALNYLFDRDFIANEILKGFAIPMYTVFMPVSPDYARVVDFMKTLEAKYRHDPSKAEQMITQALEAAGAEKKDGKWYYNGKPVEVTVVIRVEDERRQIGDYIADLLEDLGFTVKREYATGLKAYELVYSGDPKAGTWNLYTEGWAFTAMTAYDDTTPEFMFTSPGSGAVFTVYKPPKELVDACTKLASAEYQSIEERNQLVEQAVELGLKDSVRIWLVTQKTVFPHSAKLTNIAYDLIGGPYTLFALRTARLGTDVGGSITVAQRVLFVSLWNTAPGESGFTWLYDAIIRYIVGDFGVWYHPHTGSVIPLRGQFKVNTAGPNGKLDVPADAITFNPETKSWVKVGEGVKATSKVTFTYNLGKWHHGQNMTMADILYGIATSISVLNNKSEIYDPNVENPGLRTFIDKFVGLRVVDDNTIEIYINYWHPDPGFIAAQADVFEDTPWELQALMNAVVADRELAFSEARAQEWGVEGIDLAKGPSIPILKAKLDELANETYIPPEIRNFVTPEEAAARWQALENWYDEYGHLFVSNGPFYLYRADPDAGQVVLKAFRDYVYPVGYWNEYVTPKVPDITMELPPIVTTGEEATFIVKATLKGVPYSKVDMSFIALDPLTGEVITSGKAHPIGAGTFAITLSSEETAKFKPGTYEMLAIGVGKEAALPQIVSTTFTVLPSYGRQISELSSSLAQVRESLATVSSELASAIGKLADSISQTDQKVSTIEERVTNVQNTLNTAMADISGLAGTLASLQMAVYLVIILVIIALVAIFIRRK